METDINSVKAWFLAARPKTLTGAAAPVLVGTALAWSHPSFSLMPALLCLLFALVMQIDANFVNDYFDYMRGTDRADRLGPERACAQGWISPAAMRRGIVLTTLAASLIGTTIFLLSWQTQARLPWELIAVGLFCIAFCILYTTHLSYMGLGDVLVLVFFGIVPVGFTYYVTTSGGWSLDVTLAGLAMGLVTDNLLMVNNYRDRNQDRISGKRTVVVRIINICGEKSGKRAAQIIYLLQGIVAATLEAYVLSFTDSRLALLPLLYLLLHARTYHQMCLLEGKALNGILGATARNIFIFGLLFALAVVY